MAEYRAYLLNTAGQIVRALWIEADGAAEAERQARSFCQASTPRVELWLGNRKLGEVAADRGDIR
jgi:hypothetical protein